MPSTIYRFEVIARARNKGAVPIRLRYWSVREALQVERAYHNMGYDVAIQPILSSRGRNDGSHQDAA